MSQMQIDQVLAQIRALSAQTASPAATQSSPAAGGVSEFAALL